VHPADLVAQATRALAVADGQQDMVWGHLGLRDPDGRGVWMKASGWAFEEITARRVLLVGWDGAVLAGEGRAHVEYPIHTEILRRRPDVHAVVHTHPEAVNAFSALEAPLRAISHDGVPFADPPVPRFGETGDLITTAERGAALATALGRAPACLMPRHGQVSVGEHVAAAVMHAVLVTRACRTALLAHAAGGPRSWSDPAEIAAKRRTAWPPRQIQAGYDYLVRRSHRDIPDIDEE
jgi:L-fuculose-phosphate aldolase